MRKLWLINLGLLVAVISLAALVLLLPAPRQTPPPADAPPLTAHAPQDARFIRIERASDDIIELSKDAQGRWQLIAPLRLPANPFRVQSLLQVLNAHSFQQFDASQIVLRDFQLDPPAARLQIDQVPLAYGGLAPLSAQRYVQLGNTVHLLADTQFMYLSGEAAGFADLSLLGADAQPLDIQTPAYRLSKDAQGLWTLTPPPPQPISADSINSLVEEWKRLQAFSVRAYQPQPDADLEELRIVLDGQREALQLRILSRQPELILAAPDRGVQYHLPGERATTLLAVPFPPPAVGTTALESEDAVLPSDAVDDPEMLPDFNAENLADMPRSEE